MEAVWSHSIINKTLSSRTHVELWPHSELPAVIARDLSPNLKPNHWPALTVERKRCGEGRARTDGSWRPSSFRWQQSLPPSFYCPLLILFRSTLRKCFYDFVLNEQSCHPEMENAASSKVFNNIGWPFLKTAVLCSSKLNHTILNSCFCYRSLICHFPEWSERDIERRHAAYFLHFRQIAPQLSIRRTSIDPIGS